MDSTVESLSSDLNDELAANAAVDTRDVAARFHHLKAMAQSAAHCRAAFDDNRSMSLAMRVGAGVHAMLFNQPHTMFPGKVRSGKLWDAFRTAHSGTVILNRAEFTKSAAMAAAVMRHPEASRILFADDVIHERTIEWEQLGRKRRSTPDALGIHHIAELKSARCSEPNRFSRDALFRGYHAQLADQCEAVRFVRGVAPSKAYIVTVESSVPYAVTIFELTQRALDRGAQLCRLWLEQLLVCEASGHWPAYRESVEMLDVPDDDIELTFGDETNEAEGVEP